MAESLCRRHFQMIQGCGELFSKEYYDGVGFFLLGRTSFVAEAAEQGLDVSPCTGNLGY